MLSQVPEKVISKISHEKLYTSISVKHNAVAGVEKKEWFDILMVIKKYKVNRNHFEFLHVVGKGGFGKVKIN